MRIIQVVLQGPETQGQHNIAAVLIVRVDKEELYEVSLGSGDLHSHEVLEVHHSTAHDLIREDLAVVQPANMPKQCRSVLGSHAERSYLNGLADR